MESTIPHAIEKLSDNDLLLLTDCVASELHDRIRIYRTIRRLLEDGKLGRLTDKLALAAAIAPRQHAKIEARADKIIAAEPEIEKMTDESFGPHEALLDEAQKALDDLKSQLATMSNLPPLSGSDGSPPPTPGSGATSKVCPRCAAGSKPRFLNDSRTWVHDIAVEGNPSIGQIPCLNPPKAEA